jgi:hypothetical protein
VLTDGAEGRKRKHRMIESRPVEITFDAKQKVILVKSSSRMATTHRGTARITTSRSGRQAQPARSTTGRPAQLRASTTFMVSSATTPANGNQTICSAIPRRSSPILAIPVGT